MAASNNAFSRQTPQAEAVSSWEICKEDVAEAADIASETGIVMAPCGQGGVIMAPSRWPSRCWENGIPRIDPFGRHRGKLVQALSACGAVLLEVDGESRHGAHRSVPHANYGWWRRVLDEARRDRQYFESRQPVQHRFLRLSFREDLQRTVEGKDKEHTPDKRVMFGVSDTVARAKWVDWGDLWWVVQEYKSFKGAMSGLVERELMPLLYMESQWESLGSKVRRGHESWNQTAMRHCIYPEGGSCTEHTDYGVVTLQLCNSPGFEAYVSGAWRDVDIPEDCVLLFAGDMLERLTNGCAPALLHRVTVGGQAKQSVKSRLKSHWPSARQSHILFLQPDQDSVVRPLKPFVRGDGSDLAPIRYGDWHREKVSLAFNLVRGSPAASPPVKAHRKYRGKFGPADGRDAKAGVAWRQVTTAATPVQFQ